MSKIALETVIEALRKSQVNPDAQDKVVKYIEKAIEEEKDNRQSVPRQKAEFGVILLDENKELKTNNISALIYELPALGNHNEVLDNVKKAIKDFNLNTKKGQKSPVKSISEAFQVVKPKIFKQNGGLKRKTKEPVRVIISDNKI